MRDGLVLQSHVPVKTPKITSMIDESLGSGQGMAMIL
jgi:hypothetical protein